MKPNVYQDTSSTANVHVVIWLLRVTVGSVTCQLQTTGSALSHDVCHAVWFSPLQNVPALCTGIFAAAAFTDWLDGYLARRWVRSPAFVVDLQCCRLDQLLNADITTEISENRLPQMFLIVLWGQFVIHGVRSKLAPIVQGAQHD